MNNPSLFNRFFWKAIEENCNCSGVFGEPGQDQRPANQFSGDSHATGDARSPKSIFGGKIIRRPGLKSKKKR